MFAFRDRRGAVEVAFTDRHAGDGRPLNLSLVREGGPVTGPAGSPGLAEVAEAFCPGRAPVGLTQVHGGEVEVVDESWDGEEIVADALVTTAPGVPLLIRSADCVPVLLAGTGVIGAAHAGRPGLVAEVVPQVVTRMRALGATDLHAWVGPHVCGRCYEVPEELRRDVAAVVPEAWAQTSWGTPALDIGAGVRAQLDALGVASLATGRCTREDPDLWSHRREGADAGRLGALVMRLG